MAGMANWPASKLAQVGVQKLVSDDQLAVRKQSNKTFQATHVGTFEGARHYVFTTNAHRGRHLYGGELELTPLATPVPLCSIKVLRELVQWGLRVLPVKVLGREKDALGKEDPKGAPDLSSNSKLITMYIVIWSIPDTVGTLSIKAVEVSAAAKEHFGRGSSSGLTTPLAPAGASSKAGKEEEVLAPGSSSPQPPGHGSAAGAAGGKADQEWLQQWFRRWYFADNAFTTGMIKMLQSLDEGCEPSAILTPENMQVRGWSITQAACNIACTAICTYTYCQLIGFMHAMEQLASSTRRLSAAAFKA